MSVAVLIPARFAVAEMPIAPDGVGLSSAMAYFGGCSSPFNQPVAFCCGGIFLTFAITFFRRG
jgi:hypothetical protein